MTAPPSDPEPSHVPGMLKQCAVLWPWSAASVLGLPLFSDSRVYVRTCFVISLKALERRCTYISLIAKWTLQRAPKRGPCYATHCLRAGRIRSDVNPELRASSQGLNPGGQQSGSLNMRFIVKKKEKKTEKEVQAWSVESHKIQRIIMTGCRERWSHFINPVMCIPILHTHTHTLAVLKIRKKTLFISLWEN